MSRELRSRVVIISIACGGFLVPFIVVLVFYILVLRSLKSRDHNVRMMFGGDETTTIVNMSSPSITLSRNTRLASIYTLQFDDSNAAASSSLIITIQYPLSSTARKMRNIMNKRELRATKTVIWCVGLFLLTWLPFVLIIFMYQFVSDLDEWWYANPMAVSLPSLFVITSTIFDPIIYTLVNPECKIHVKRLVACRRKFF